MSDALNRSIIHAALLSSGYSVAQADTRIIEFERDVIAAAMAYQQTGNRLEEMADDSQQWWLDEATKYARLRGGE